MGRNTLFVLGLLLFDGLAVALGLWQFWDARPDKKAKADQLVEGGNPSVSLPKDPGHLER
jgi:hypothetical protein